MPRWNLSEMKWGIAMLIIGTVLAAAIAVSTNPKERLCGREYVSAQELVEGLRTDHDVKEFKSHEGVAVFLDAKKHTLWWLSGGTTGSIITCKTKIESSGGYANSAVEADCGGDRSGRCFAQVQAMAKAKF